jgi:cytochrome c oxidase subunit 1/cytochrome c oxidase subunit I+III
MLYAVGFVSQFTIGGLSGVMHAVVPVDTHHNDSYFVVAHFHYVLFGGAVFPVFAGLYYWLPKITGRLLDERLGQASFWLIFVGFNLTFFPMHISGLLGMPRRVYTYPRGMGWDAYNLLATIGGFVLAVGILVVVVNVFWSRRRGAPAGPDPWGGNTLEWSISSPPPHFNFAVIPTVRSANPNWDLPDREEDLRRLEDGELVLAEGHETLQSTVLDADVDKVLEMPSESPWPLLLALALLALFTALLVDLWTAAVVGGGLVAAALASWHYEQPMEVEA